MYIYIYLCHSIYALSSFKLNELQLITLKRLWNNISRTSSQQLWSADLNRIVALIISCPRDGANNSRPGKLPEQDSCPIISAPSHLTLDLTISLVPFLAVLPGTSHSLVCSFYFARDNWSNPSRVVCFSPYRAVSHAEIHRRVRPSARYEDEVAAITPTPR